MEAETKMRAKGKGGMTDAEVVDFVDRYMPAYKVRDYHRSGHEIQLYRLGRSLVHM